MAETIQCAIHGERRPAFICAHLTSEDVCAQGFNHLEATDEDPIPDAWCNNCEISRKQVSGWTEETTRLADIRLVCAGCYNQSRIRNSIPDTTLDDLADLKWKCGSCEEWHTGPCLDFGYDWPDYWSDEHEKQHNKTRLLPSWGKKPRTWRNEDYAVCDDEHFFVRGIIHLPIIGTNETFRWGVWGSLSRDNFARLMEREDKEERVELGPMFSWLCNWPPEYGEYESTKMDMHIQEPGKRPHFSIHHTDHPLAQEYHHGIHPRRVKEIMLNRWAYALG
jgi:hypothetical protein